MYFCSQAMTFKQTRLTDVRPAVSELHDQAYYTANALIQRKKRADAEHARPTRLKVPP
jgi:hypothetical protein